MSQLTLPADMQIKAAIKPGHEKILTPDALTLVAQFDLAFEARRQEL